MGENVPVSIPGESYEEWLARTAPAHPVRTTNPRTWDWGVIVLLGLFFGWALYEGSAQQGWIGLGLVAVLVVELVLHARLLTAESPRRDRALRGVTLLLTLMLSGWLIWVEPGVMFALPALLVMLDLEDERSFLRFAWEGLRQRRRARTDGPRSHQDPGPSAG